MTGDQGDFAARIRLVMPSQWFPDCAPILDGLLGGLGAGWALIYNLLQYVRQQTRIATSTGDWLDATTLDFFGLGLARKSGETDDALRVRIDSELFRERSTRKGVIRALTDLTGRVPEIFEPALASDTGGYTSSANEGGGVAYNVHGGWGSLQLHFQCFITAYRPSGGGISCVAGWDAPAGGYGVAAVEYASPSMMSAPVTDADIYTTVANVMPVATIGWVCITD